jgi:hypothetical protein
VAELDASDGSLVQVVSGSKYALDDPLSVAADGTHVWVVSNVHSCVTELTIG